MREARQAAAPPHLAVRAATSACKLAARFCAASCAASVASSFSSSSPIACSRLWASWSLHAAEAEAAARGCLLGLTHSRSREAVLPARSWGGWMHR